jgi:hypothetical protein
MTLPRAGKNKKNKKVFNSGSIRDGWEDPNDSDEETGVPGPG